MRLLDGKMSWCNRGFPRPMVVSSELGTGGGGDTPIPGGDQEREAIFRRSGCRKKCPDRLGVSRPNQ